MKSLYQILLDSHNEGTTSEGACPQDMLDTLKLIAQDPALKCDFPKLEQALNDDVFLAKSEHTSEIIDRLKSAGQVFILGGWVSTSGGHALYMRLNKNDNQYTLTLYNRGAGI